MCRIAVGGFAQMIHFGSTSRLDQVERIKAHLRVPLYRNGYALLVTAASTTVLGVVFWAAAVRFYTAEVVGFNSAAISAMIVVAGVASFSFQGVLVRFLPSAGADARRLILAAYAISAGAAVVLSTLFVQTVSAWSPNLGALGSNGAIGAGFVLATMLWCVFNLQDGALTGLRHTLWVPLENILYALSKLGLLLLLAAAMPQWGILVAWVLPAAVAIIPINLLLLRRFVAQPGTSAGTAAQNGSRNRIARYIAGNYPGTLFNLALTALLPLVVTQLAGLRATAFFYMPWMIYTGLQLAPINLATSLTVEAAHDERKLGLYCYRVLVQSLRLLGPVVVVFLVGAHWILLVFGPEYAAEGTVLLRLLALATVPNILVVLYISVLRVQNRVWGLVLVQGALAGLLLGMSYWLLPLWGITGVGVAALVSQTVVAVALMFSGLAPVLYGGRAEHLHARSACNEIGVAVSPSEGIN
jgi:O-antigen/teichoic acid export membrane protein